MEIRQFTVEEMEHFKRMMPKDSGFRIIFTHNFSQKFKDNKFNLILDFLKNTDYNITKNKVHLIKNDGFYGQCGQDITKNSLILEFDNIDDSREAIFYALYLAETYKERFVVYLYKEKIAYHVRYSELDNYPYKFRLPVNKIKNFMVKNSLLEIDKLMTDGFVILKSKGIHSYPVLDKTSYGIKYAKNSITILPKTDVVEYLQNYNAEDRSGYLYRDVDYILVKEGNKLNKYDRQLNYIKTYKINGLDKFIRRAFYKNIAIIEKHEYSGISHKFYPHYTHNTIILYQKNGHRAVSSI